MNFKHEIVEIDQGSQVDVQVDSIDSFFIFSPVKEFVENEGDSMAVFEDIMQYSLPDFWESFSDQYARYRLLSLYDPKITSGRTEQEAQTMVYTLFVELIERSLFTEDHCLVMTFPTFQNDRTKDYFTCCVGFTFKSSKQLVYLMGFDNGVRPR